MRFAVKLTFSRFASKSELAFHPMLNLRDSIVDCVPMAAIIDEILYWLIIVCEMIYRKIKGI